MDLNHRRSALQADALPTGLRQHENGEEFSPLRWVCLAVSGVPPEPGGFIHPRTLLTKFKMADSRGIEPRTMA